ncbi:MAG: hypothetical protein FWF59_13585 [Turicibacter sp.]|nr:hypothetical protein [Turicibacter sp.]
MNGFNRCGCGGNKGFTPAPAPAPECTGNGFQPVPVRPLVKPAFKSGGHTVTGHQAVPSQWDSVAKVQEQAVECVQEYHHYAKVEHVIPVYVKNIHHQHTQHDYVIQQAGVSDETLCYEYGLECEKDVCDLIAQCGCR